MIGNRKEAIQVWKQLLSPSNAPEFTLQIWTNIATLHEEMEQEIIRKEAGFHSIQFSS